MLRRLSLRSRRALCSVMLALLAAPATGCSLVHRWMPWHGHAAESDASGVDADGGIDASRAQRTRDRLRDARDRAWAQVARGGDAGDYRADDALALAAAERAVDATARWEHAPTPGRATLADLPRADWWYLFVPPSAWAKGPLAVDHERAPGTYAAMMGALERVLGRGQAGGALDADWYLELHRLASLGVFDRDRGAPLRAGWSHAPNRYPIAALHDLGALHVDHLAQALAELKAEGVAGWSADLQRDRSDDAPPPWLAKLMGAAADVNPDSKPAQLVYVRGPHGHAFEQWLVGVNAFADHEARAWVSEWLTDYAAEQQKAPHRTPDEWLELLASQPPVDDLALELKPSARPSEDLLAAVRPIARLVRRLQVTHAFDDRAEAVDVVLVMQYLLAANGLPPAVIDDPSMFGGREPLDVLAAAIVRGQLRFQSLVRELAAREAEPAAAPARAPAAPALGAPQLPGAPMPGAAPAAAAPAAMGGALVAPMGASVAPR